MPYIPHTEQDVKEMVGTLGIANTDALFAEIPKHLMIDKLPGIPEGMSEMEVARLLTERAAKDRTTSCFIGAGAYEHHIPAVVWDIASRGEFLTAYTPYQAEASQGTLQVIYEYQSMMTQLMAMDVSNASMYDGATALAEAILMAVRANKRAKSNRVLIPHALHPAYRKVIRTATKPHHVELVEIPFDAKTGAITMTALQQLTNQPFAAIVIAQPNFFGSLEDVDTITDWAHQQGALVIANVNPTAMALLKAPGQWGATGADIAAGDGQPLGAPLSYGGPYFGYMCCRKDFVRQLPGRIVGRTIDTEGNPGFVLTLQAREQHIRRAKATSNICSNQALLATAATIYLSLLGTEGLKRVAAASHENATKLRKQLLSIKGIETVFNHPFFHEFVIRLSKPVTEVLAKLAANGIQGGYELIFEYPELGNCLLICATETKSAADLQNYVTQLEKAL